MYALYHVLNKPEKFTLKQIDYAICQAIGHVPEHIAAAAKLVVDTQIRDIFEEGVLGKPEVYPKKKRRRPRTVKPESVQKRKR